MSRKDKRSQSKLPVPAAAGDGDSKEAKPRSSSSVGSAGERDVEEHADIEGPPRVNVVEGQSAAGDGIARNLLPDLDEEAKMEDIDLQSLIDEIKAEPTTADPGTPVTRAVNAVPVKMDPTMPNAVPARMIEVIMAKHEGMKYLAVKRIGPASDVRDPGFASMTHSRSVLEGIVSLFGTAGYSVTIVDYAKVVSTPRAKLVAAGQALYDLFLRHQMQRKLEQAAAAGRGGLVDAKALQTFAEQYFGRSRADVQRLETQLMLSQKNVRDLEAYLQDFADRVSPGEAANTGTATPNATPAQPVGARTESKPKVEVNTAPPTSAANVVVTPRAEAKWSATDYLADIYDDCVGPTRGVNTVTQFRQSACANVKPFNGQSRDEFRGKSFLSSVRSAFRQDGLNDGQCCIKFPEMITGTTKIWYRQLPRDIRKDWNKLQIEFEKEYCGATITPHQRYYELRRKPSEEPLDYLYRLNVQAMEAGIDFADAAGAFHVTHFLDTCEDPDLARQFGLAKPTTEEGLRTALKELLRQKQRMQRDENIKSRAEKRDAKTSKPPAKADCGERAE